ncbi:NADH:flavin oxidoreductase [Rufibacter tibetensis]|uniref:NADH:flavin oxidoreductase n=1 Tax=Rufibacter tibetensis TaxID=512763 RepID=A0A0P0CWC8_9BACT|nr:NADH:flavin oxidoreductase [Rufibacter tibetensis]ALI98674.1 NADH:flavin oxidoreductase [Rufibacter tibetensis]
MNQQEEKKNAFPLLFSEGKLGNLHLKNRVGLAPMTRTSADPDGTPNEAMKKYYTRYAQGGFGLLITEGTYPDELHSQGYLNQPGITNPKHIAAWQEINQSVQAAGAKIICQIMHAGALSQGNRYKDYTIGPSAVTPKGTQMEFYGGKGAFPTPKEMTIEDIQSVVKGFTQAAKNAVEAGFDGIEIHGANGYILDQFLTDYTNQRQDEYGGDPARRVRLLVETVQACRAAVGNDFPIGIRISQTKVNDYTHSWAGAEEDAKVIFTALGNAGLDFIHVTEHHADKPAFQEGSPTLAALAKKYGNLPVVVNGHLDTPEKAEAMLQTGDVDVVTLGKTALANKDWVNKVAAGQPLDEFAPERFFVPDAKVKEFEQ